MGKQFLFKAPEVLEEPITLEINVPEEQPIRCVDGIDGLRILLFTSIIYGQFGIGVRAKEIHDFLKDCIADEEWERFTGLVAKYRIDIEGLGDMAMYLADLYSDLPTTPAQTSSSGQGETGPSSEVSSSSSESTIPI